MSNDAPWRSGSQSVAVSEGLPEPLGVTLRDGGANVAVVSRHAHAIWLCLFDEADRETDRIRLDEEFLAANPDLKPDMIAVACSGGQNARLKEVHICFSKEGQPRSCGRNEEQRRLCKAPKVAVPPVRSTKH